MVPDRMTALIRVPSPIITSRPNTSCSSPATPPGQSVGEEVCPPTALTGKSVRVEAPWQAMRNPMTIRYSDRPMGGSDLRSGMRLHHFRLDPPVERADIRVLPGGSGGPLGGEPVCGLWHRTGSTF